MYTASFSVLLICILAAIGVIAWSLTLLRRSKPNANRVMRFGYTLGMTGVLLWAILFGGFSV